MGTACTRECGSGSQTSQRQIAVAAVNRGTPCKGGLKKTRPCATQACVIPGLLDVDCKWGHWEEWGECTKCGGQQFRDRRVFTMPAVNGDSCKARDSRETRRCPRNCGDKTYCA